MDLFTWFGSVSPDDWELLLYFIRIILPIITLFLWIKGSSITDVFDRVSMVITTVGTALLGLLCRFPAREPPATADDNGVKFHVTSKVDLPRGQKVSRRWLVSWKPVPEDNGQSCNSFNNAGTSREETSNGGTKVVYFDPTTGMTFNVNTSIQSIGGEPTLENENDVRNRSPDETAKTK